MIFSVITHRIHGAGIYANSWHLGYMDGIHVTIYSGTMDPIWVITQPFERPQTIYGFTPDTPLLHDTHALVNTLLDGERFAGRAPWWWDGSYGGERKKRYQKPYCSSFYNVVPPR